MEASIVNLSSDLGPAYNQSQDTNTSDYFNYQPVPQVLQTPMDIATFTLCVVGLVANILSVIATANIPHGLTTHSKLIISLGLSDALIAASVGMFDFISNTSSYCPRMLQKSLLDTAILATLTNLLAMAIDHYVAIMKPMRYHQLMSRAHGNILILIIWLISIFAGSLELLIIVIMEADKQILCQDTQSEMDIELFILGFILFVLLVIVIIYTKIYFVVKRLVMRDNTLIQDNMHNHKAIVTTFLIIGTFMFCWLPSCIFQIVMLVRVYVDAMSVTENFQLFILLHKIFIIFLLFNTLCDPVIYAIRLKEVQNGYRRLLYKCFPRYRQVRNEEEFRNSNQRIRRSTISTTIVDNNGSTDPNNRLSDSHSETSIRFTSNSSTYEQLIICQDSTYDDDVTEKMIMNNNSHT